MPQHRTKEQKRRAVQHRSLGEAEPQVFSYTATGETKKPVTAQKVLKEVNLVEFTKRDLLKTAVVSVVLGILLVGIFQYLRYNG
ncbi:hypothetical protein KA078_00125 [Candidatus Woesebacteria bacterium]|nr:hypothetical protein [Candidatus Woesebacteria bacterium]